MALEEDAGCEEGPGVFKEGIEVDLSAWRSGDDNLSPDELLVKRQRGFFVVLVFCGDLI